MNVIATLDDYGMAAWIGAMVLGFIVFWPIGLAILAYLIWSGRMTCWKNKHWGRNEAPKWRGGRWANLRPTGNEAFDDYRQETLRRLEAEADEFRAFLERLRKARDKAEFDQFMTERGGGAAGRPEQPAPAPSAG